MDDFKTPVIRLENISKHFPGVQALDRVSVDIYPGEIHAIIGENGAGKSTLVNILAGEVRPDSGQIIFMGEERQIPDPHVSQQLGISVVYQETALCPNLSIAENICLPLVKAKPALSMINRRQFAKVAEEALARLGIHHLDLSTPVGRLSVAQQQLIEIAKAISIQAKVLILDEPNSALTPEETNHLFTVLRQLREDGVAIIFVSHRLEEVMSLADRITVLRDGKYIETLRINEATIEGLISRMVGRAIEGIYERKGESTICPEVAFSVTNLSCANGVEQVTFQIHKGEMVGIAGLPDSGKDELVECLFGLHPYRGEIRVNGRVVQIKNPSTAIAHGLAFAPADRRGSGAMLVLSVLQNMTASSLKNISNAGILNQTSMRKLSQYYVDKLEVRISSLGQQMATLSGGNQQKVILARGLATQPSVLLLHEPTRGIDVGAKAEIYTILHALAAEGVAVLIVSSELPELIGQCDRILVMHQGRITGHFLRSEASEEPILACAVGQAEHLQN